MIEEEYDMQEEIEGKAIAHVEHVRKKTPKLPSYDERSREIAAQG